MSRTYRKRKKELWSSNEYSARIKYLDEDAIHSYGVDQFDTIEPEYYSCYRENWEYAAVFSRTSKQGKKLLAKYHSDAGTTECKEPGPRAWKNLVTHRPYRRKYSALCRKALYNDDLEIVLEKLVYPYWT